MTYVVLIKEYDYDSPRTDWLVSCATFSTKEKAQQYAKRKSEQLAERYDGFVDDESVYDDEGHIAAILTIVETIIDEFEEDT